MSESDDFSSWRRTLPEVTGALVRMRQKAYSDGAIPAKYKALMALCMAAVDKCEPCLNAYVEKARDLGVTDTEFTEALEVVVTFAGCVGEQWALKAWKIWKKENRENEGCCSVES
ncbi:MAG: hypothetical protein PWP37_1743 [Thermotogota bacterium]|nr:hypothetical protein [Thermotogota bacterium]MDK2865551.1 hypothetical protein [Thermotogota bacterium]HCZ06401.1 carboxymuconolactone decarboxylase family protein [Thermotogota bacterium]